MKHVALLLAGLAAAAPLAAQHGHDRPLPAGQQPPPQHPAPATTLPHGPARPVARIATLDGTVAMVGMESLMAALAGVSPFAPDRLLERRGDLRLNVGQEAHLAELARRLEATRDSALAAGREHARALAETLETPGPDPETADRQFAAALGAITAAHRAALRAALDSRSLLTDAQRSQVQAGAFPTSNAR